MSNPYSPTVAEGESSADIWFERSLFVGGFLGAVAYGLHLAVFGISVYFLNRQPNKAKGKATWSFIVYIILLLTCGTINIAAAIKVNELTWIDNRDFPGGPVAWSVTMYNVMVDILGDAAYIVANFLADGLLIWRCFIVYGGNYWVIIIPSLTFIVSTVLSILTVFQAARPMASIWSQSAVVIALPYWSLSIALNTVVSLMIVGRLLWFRHSASKTLGARHATMYAGLAAVFIESAALYTITGLVFLICYARNSNVQNLVLGILSQVVCLAPELIILRVALGRAWSVETFNRSTTLGISFNPMANTGMASAAAVSVFGSSDVSPSGGRTHMDSVYDGSNKPITSFDPV